MAPVLGSVTFPWGAAAAQPPK